MKQILLGLLQAAFLLAVSNDVQAQALDNFTFQGVLTDSTGQGVDTTVDMTTNLYQSGNVKHTQLHNDVDVENGVFKLTIVNTDSISFDSPYELGITVGGESEMTPRTPLLMVPYAQSLLGFRVYPVGHFSATGGPNLEGGHPDNGVSRSAYSSAILSGGTSLDPNFIFSGNASVIAGGDANQIDAGSAAIGGGSDNAISGTWGTVSGGQSNTASGNHATVGGGVGNTATELRATIPGGRHNYAAGNDSYASGERAAAIHAGAWVWQDATAGPTDTLFSSQANEFTVRASGGIRFFTSDAPDETTGAFIAPDGSGFGVVSSRSVKTDLEDVDPVAYLEKIAAMDIKRWRYATEDESTSHVGPFAEDFQDAFGFSADRRTINSIDIDGVSLVAIQGLYQIVREQAETIEQLRAELRER